MELSQIRYFLDAAQTQHITKSAQHLNIAQPALTKAIHKLEDELGVPLFVRRGRNIALTQYGRYLMEKLLPLVHALDTVPAELAHMAKAENNTIRLSVLAASTIVTQAIIDYKKQYPQIHFHVLQNPHNELFDIEITTNLFFNNAEPQDNRFVCTEEIFLAVPDIGKYGDKDEIRLQDVREEGFISLFGSRQLRSICDTFCRHAGFEPNIIFESDSPQAVRNMIGANLGVGFWPEFTWGKLGTEHVRLLRIAEPICRRDILVTCKSLKADMTNVENFFAFLKQYLLERKL
ncbi:MAG: LysR family transcriptional regulator [Hominenteromicrobium sp.]